MYINTVGFYTGSLSLAGNPSVYSVSPAFYSSYTDDMTLFQRTVNTVFHVFANVVHAVSASKYLCVCVCVYVRTLCVVSERVRTLDLAQWWTMRAMVVGVFGAHGYLMQYIVYARRA